MSKLKHIKIPKPFTKKGAIVNPPYHMCPSVWTMPVPQDDDKRMLRTKKSIVVKEFTVLKKYPIKVVLRYASRVNKSVIDFSEVSFMIAMDEDKFADLFPKTFAQLIFKNLLDDGETRHWISYDDFLSKLGRQTLDKNSNVVPSLSYKKPFVVFMERSDFNETRRRVAQYLRVTEKYEQKLGDGEAKVQSEVRTVA